MLWNINHKLETCKVYYLFLSEYGFQRMEDDQYDHIDHNELA